VLSAQQNNIGCKITNTVQDEVLITIPSGYAGNLAITFRIENVTTTAPMFEDYVKTGNIVEVADLYAAGNQTTDNPNPFVVSAGKNGANTVLIFEGHIRCSPATNATDNTFKLRFNPGVYAPATQSSSCLIIQEYNAGFSYRASNQGTSDAPIMVSSTGVITSL
jgi:hypothetical protein